jgi:hypothetical protein
VELRESRDRTVGATTGSVHTSTVGNATITVSYGGQSATSNLTVTPGTLVSVAAVTPATYLYVPGSDSTVTQYTNSAAWGPLQLSTIDVPDGDPDSIVIEPRDKYAYERASQRAR